MKLELNYLSRRDLKTNHFDVKASVKGAVDKVTSDFKTDPLGSLTKYSNLAGEAVTAVKAAYVTIKRDVFGNWSDVRNGWQAVCKPYFLPKDTPADEVFQLALTQAAAASDLCIKNKYSMAGHGTYAWFLPWVFYFDKPISFEEVKYQIWARGESWGQGYEAATGTDFIDTNFFTGALDKVQNGGEGWLIGFYTPRWAFYDDWYKKCLDIFQRLCVDKVLAIKAETEKPAQVVYNYTPPNSDYLKISSDFQQVTFKKGKKYAWGNNGTYLYFDTQRVPKHWERQNWDGVTLTVGSGLWQAVFGSDPLIGVNKGVFETDSPLQTNKYENAILGNFGVSGKLKDYLKNMI